MNKYIYIAFACVTLSSCSNQEEVSSTDGDALTPILLSAGVEDVSTEAQAESARDAGNAFPNGGKISVIAANNKGENTGWTSLHIDNKTATAGTISNGKYPFTWDFNGDDQWGNQTYYWPFNPDEKLVFVAYSPTASTDGVVTAVAGSETSFKITLKDKADVDVMYTKPTEAMNKTTEIADLGQFQHALAKVQVVVKTVDTQGNYSPSDIFSVISMAVNTSITTGTFDLTKSTLALDDAAQNATSYTIFDPTDGHALDKALTEECYVFPDSQDHSSVTLNLKDKKGINFEETYSINEFTNAGTNKKDLTFIAGKTTVLTFKVQVKTSPDEGDNDKTNNIILTGDLKDWECNGKFEVGIE